MNAIIISISLTSSITFLMMINYWLSRPNQNIFYIDEKALIVSTIREDVEFKGWSNFTAFGNLAKQRSLTLNTKED